MSENREVRGFRAAELDESTLAALGAVAAELGPGAPGDEHDEYLRWRAAELRRGRVGGVLSWSDEKAVRVARRALTSAVAIRARLRIESGKPEAVQPRRGWRDGAPRPREALQAAAAEGCAPWLDLGVAAGVGRELWDEPCEQWIVLPDNLPRGRFVALTVAGDSMEPLMHAGDVVLTEVGAPIRRDAIVVARRGDDGYVVKRVGNLAEREVELLSLNPEYPPMRVPREAGSVVGTVVMRWCAHEQ